MSPGEAGIAILTKGGVHAGLEGVRCVVARTIWIFGDQLSLDHPGLRAGPRTGDRLLFIESRKRGARLRYHRHKLVLIYAAMRHFAAVRRAEGWAVDYHELAETEDFEGGWRRHLAAGRPEEIVMCAPNNRFEHAAVEALARKLGLPVRFLPAVNFLVPREEFAAWAKGSKRLLMENHYRRVRRELGVLVDDRGEPEGGAWNFDAENRKPFKDFAAGATPPAPPRGSTDAVTRAVIADVTRFFPDAPGDAETFWLPVTRAEALGWLEDFVGRRLGNFGDFQDVMAAGERTMFHSLLSPMMNIGLLQPRECVDAAVEAYRAGRAPLAATEGFVRQILGWREFVNGVYWLKGEDYLASNGLGAERALPAFFYDGRTDMNCVRECVEQVRATSYNHHIQRLMVLGNFLLLAGVRPQEALRWFTEMYVDAHEWVMAANVLGMALHADGGFMATKPYAGGGAYISRMSDYCRGCRFDPAKKSGPGACPFNLLYWNFYDRHGDRFARNPRTAMMVRSWRSRPEAERARIVAEAEGFLGELGDGR